jgi:hypothetical protein
LHQRKPIKWYAGLHVGLGLRKSLRTVAAELHACGDTLVMLDAVLCTAGGLGRAETPVSQGANKKGAIASKETNQMVRTA